jgi:uncharacterized protein
MNAPPAFHVLVKPAGAACNLACEYCFYLSKGRLYPNSHFRMPDEVLEAYIQQLLSSQQMPEINVAWQGGEPTLMGLDFFRRSIELARKYKRPGQQVHYALQTNGTRLDDEWCAFFKEHNFLIGLSMDGPPEMHNAYRGDKARQGSYDQVRHGWDLLQKHNVDTNILCAVHTANSSHPVEVYRFFRDDLQARFIQFIPIVEKTQPETPVAEHHLPLPKSQLVSSRSVKSKQYGRFLIDVFEEWVHHDVGTVFVQIFDSALASWCRIPASVCIFQETCGLSLILEHTGDLYSCDHFVEPEHCLGNILKTPMIELVTSSAQRQFGLDKRDRLPVCCLTCDVKFACHGECPRNRFLRTPGGGLRGGDEEGLNFLCAGYQLFYHHIDHSMRIMARLLRHGRSPAEIMQM